MTKEKRTYVERDVSWMYFNHRILQEAEKEQVPLLERLSFLGIYSNNLDEFFRVRVASINRFLENPHLEKATKAVLKQSLKAINKLNKQYSVEYSNAVASVRNALKGHGINIITEKEVNDAQQKFLTDFFYNKLNGSVNPIWLSEIKEISRLEDNRIYLVVDRVDIKEKQKTKYAIVKIPDRLFGRFIKLPSEKGRDDIMYLDDVVRFCLPLIFLGMKESAYKAYSFKFTKDAEMDIDNDQDYSTLEKITAGVNSRKRGDAVRVIYDGDMPKEI
jgi:polyphosphate kinase